MKQLSLSTLEKTNVFNLSDDNNLILINYLDILTDLENKASKKDRKNLEFYERQRFNSIINLTQYVSNQVNFLLSAIDDQHQNSEILALSYKVAHEASNLTAIVENLSRIRENNNSKFFPKKIDYKTLKNNYLIFVYKHMDLTAILTELHYKLSEILPNE